MIKNKTDHRILLVIPPFTQLNAPYPATAFLKGFLAAGGIAAHQCDLGISVILAMFSATGLTRLFREAVSTEAAHSANARRITGMQEKYTGTIGTVIAFLQGRDPSLAHRICSGRWLPEASRSGQMTDLDHAFGDLGIHDRAKYLATLYLEDIADLITETADPHFGFSRYAERLGRSASSFDELYAALSRTGSFTDRFTEELLEEKLREVNPTLVALSIPFPGNLYGALKCGQWIRRHHPGTRIVLGGGYVNTELRSLADPRVFEFADFITLDDGEAPLAELLRHLEGQIPAGKLKRTFTPEGDRVVFNDGSDMPDVARDETGTPDYTGLEPAQYLSVLEIANPMHRLWSDGFWNKLMLAHGCYWGKCTFCDVSLDYISRYEANRASTLCDRMEAIIATTGRSGFHFTDEAAPPVLLRSLALEILRRKMTVTWWTNIRFEQSFTPDQCRLLQASGCIAVSGGLEVASDRILKLINKGVTVSQVTRVAGNFTRAGIMVHAYLMYGFPTQTAQETIDSLEVVRQLFREGVVTSGFWHQFAMTVHSPVGMDPQRFGAEPETTAPGSFANNDLAFTDTTGCDHGEFSDGLKRSLYNFMHGLCFDFPLQDWFDFRIPRTKVVPEFIRGLLAPVPEAPPAPHAKLVWLGPAPVVHPYSRLKKGKTAPAARIILQGKKKEIVLHTGEATGKWLAEILPLLMPENPEQLTIGMLQDSFGKINPGNFRTFWESTEGRALRENGLVVV